MQLHTHISDPVERMFVASLGGTPWEQVLEAHSYVIRDYKGVVREVRYDDPDFPFSKIRPRPVLAAKWHFTTTHKRDGVYDMTLEFRLSQTLRGIIVELGGERVPESVKPMAFSIAGLRGQVNPDGRSALVAESHEQLRFALDTTAKTVCQQYWLAFK